MKGSYILLLHLRKTTTIHIGSLGKISFEKGYYAYVGSALNNLHNRIKRHLRNRKKLHWHIDYLLQKAEIEKIYYIDTPEREECRIARELSDILNPVKNFGCSDCRCYSHLFYMNDNRVLQHIIQNLGLKEMHDIEEML
jgi:Uri superfamily endonuclease